MRLSTIKPTSLSTILIALSVFYFSYLMGQIIFPYTSGELDIDFLQTKQHIIHLLSYRWTFYLHIFSSLFVLAAGITQFSSYFLKHYPQWHRWVGKMYVGIILFISGPSALWMSFYANGGIGTQFSFVLLSILWWWFTFRGYQTIRQGKVAAHRAFLIRSYALTLSAISLRFYQLVINSFWYIDPDTVYFFVSWLGWLGNLLVAEWWIRRKRFVASS